MVMHKAIWVEKHSENGNSVFCFNGKNNRQLLSFNVVLFLEVLRKLFSEIGMNTINYSFFEKSSETFIIIGIGKGYLRIQLCSEMVEE